MPGGTVQLDVVFNETLPAPAAVTELQPLRDGPGCRVLAASPELSLVWKLLWLAADAYPQGKDLYDAVLLAEARPPRYELVRDTFVLGGTEGLRPTGAWWRDWLDVETGWGHFITEHPWVTESAASYRERPTRALAPLLEKAVRPEEDACSQWSRWLKPLVKSTRTTVAELGTAGLGYLAEGGHAGPAAAVVTVRELSGLEVSG
ncbi:nucleotidyl transferase AbiEii/AbiGii toxin family protein [Streptomyces sp. NPDC056708]|uniref:nucleotidyl transferase AbiEii/AbiGii toxin family protein n=1 Tax=unclassified Streptomyces TaxID=2593676 RepID=UPI0036B2168D